MIEGFVCMRHGRGQQRRRAMFDSGVSFGVAVFGGRYCGAHAVFFFFFFFTRVFLLLFPWKLLAVVFG